MKTRLMLTFLLLVLCAGAVTVALKSYDNGNNRLESAREIQSAREEAKNLTPTPEPVTPTPIPEPTATPAPVDPALPVLTLSAETIEITAGTNFSVISPVADITDDKDERSYLFRRIYVSGDYSTQAAGQYTLQYTVTDSDGNQSLPATLTLIVK